MRSGLTVNGERIGFSNLRRPGEVPWEQAGVDIVLECSGKFLTPEALQPYFDRGRAQGDRRRAGQAGRAQYRDGRQRSVSTIPHLHHIVTAASCTTNCLAPVVKVIHEKLGIRHGVITTIHDVTNTQTIVDLPHKDLRRARSALMSLIPTTTGSATAIGLIYPELQGKAERHGGSRAAAECFADRLRVRGRATRRPSKRSTDSCREAADGPLRGILGFEERPLVSVDFLNDPRSSIVDGPSTMVVDGTQVKILAWYDNEWGYVNRLVELAAKVAASPAGRWYAERMTAMSTAVRNYALVTGAYWGFTLTDGALRMLVLLHFDRLGYSAVAIAFLFLFYEFFGIVTNLLGGWIAARSGLEGHAVRRLAAADRRADHARLAAARHGRRLASVAYVMAAQALSGIAKDLTKMSAKSAIKVVVPEGEDGALFKWVARLTGSKNALKGRRLLSGRRAAERARLRRARWSRWPPGLPSCLLGHRGRAAERYGQGEIEGQIHDAVLQEPGGQLAFGRAAVSVRGARCLVRGRIAGLPGLDPGMVILAGRRIRRLLVRRLRHGPGNRARRFCARSGARQGVTGDTARLWAFVLIAIPLALAAALRA